MLFTGGTIGGFTLDSHSLTNDTDDNLILKSKT